MTARTDLLRGERIIVPPSQRIRNWRTLPVEGSAASKREGWLFAWGALAALLVLLLFAVKP